MHSVKSRPRDYSVKEFLKSLYTLISILLIHCHRTHHRNLLTALNFRLRIFIPFRDVQIEQNSECMHVCTTAELRLALIRCIDIQLTRIEL